MATYNGTNNNESYTGTTDPDYIYGFGGNDTLSGGDGNDTIDGGDGNDTLDGGTDNDQLYGGAGKDAVSGGTGDDTIYLSVAGEVVSGETYNGGDGFDIIRSNAGTAFDLSVVTLTSIEGLVDDTSSGLVVTAAQADALTYLLASNLTLATAGTVDLTGASIDTNGVFNLAAGGNRLVLTGTHYSTLPDYALGQTVIGGAGVDTVFGTAAGDTISGNGGNDALDGDAGNDTLDGGDANDTLTGGAGQDVIYGRDGNDTLDGGTDNDQLYGGAGKDAVSGGTGDDTIYLTLASEVVSGETYNGGDGYDLMLSYVGAAFDLSVVTLTSIEGLADNGGEGFVVTAAQADALTYLSVTRLTIATAGTVDLTGASLDNDTIFTLAAGGNRLVLTGTHYSTLPDYVRSQTVIGGAGVDTVFGTAAGDTISGNGGNDTLDGDAGNDTLNGGDGFDTASYTTAAAAVTVSLALQGQQQNTGSAGLDTLTNFENLTGSRLGDTLTGDDGANVIEGGAGNDTLDGGAGKDVASYASATSGVTVTLAVKSAQTTGGAGNDRLANFEGLAGSAFADTLTGDAKANTLTGAAGNDVMRGDAGNDRLEGGDGVDVAIYSGSFTDYAIVATANGFTVTDLRGGKSSDGTDTLVGVETVRLNGQDFAIADAANVGPTAVADTAGPLREAGGHGPGIAAASGSVLANDLDPNLGVPALGEKLTVAGVQAGGTSGTFGTVTAAGTVIQGTYGTLTIKADGTYTYQLDNDRPATDALASGQTVQEVFGYRIVDAHGVASTATLSVAITGDNEVTAVAGADKLLVTLGTPTALSPSVLLANDSGDPGEVLSVTGVSNAVGASVSIVNGVLVINATSASGSFDYTLTTATGGTTTGHVTFDAVTMKSAANLITAATDVAAADLVGNRGDDVFTGSAGNDRLIGNLGDDVLDGRGGADQMTGGAGNDRYVVDSTGDQVVELAGGGIDSVVTALASYTLDAQLENLSYSGTGSFAGTGNALANVLAGGVGADTLLGSDGDDVLIGGRGADLLDGGAGLDTASYTTAARGVFVDLRVTGAQATGVGADTLTGIENLTGSAYDDLLFGSDGANVLTGGRGADVLLGGRGADTFAFAALTDSTAAQMDRIADFSRAQGDRIDLSLIDPDAAVAGDQAFTFIGSAAFTGAGGTNFELRVVAFDDDLFQVEADVNHDGVADLAITVAAVSPLQAADFVL